MKRIERIIQSPVAPNTPDSLWLDDSNPANPSLKAFINGEFKSISAGGGGETLTPPILNVLESQVTGTKAEVIAALGITEEQFDNITTGKYNSVIVKASDGTTTINITTPLNFGMDGGSQGFQWFYLATPDGMSQRVYAAFMYTGSVYMAHVNIEPIQEPIGL